MPEQTTDIVPPTCEQLYCEDGFKSVFREADDSWRHGARVTQVFQRESDGTFWQAHYRLSTDQETNELREGDAKITRVYPNEQTITIYTPNP